MSCIEFYVVDGQGCQVSDEKCGCVNAFSTYAKAERVAKMVSRRNTGIYSVDIAFEQKFFQHGQEVNACRLGEFGESLENRGTK